MTNPYQPRTAAETARRSSIGDAAWRREVDAHSRRFDAQPRNVRAPRRRDEDDELVEIQGMGETAWVPAWVAAQIPRNQGGTRDDVTAETGEPEPDMIEVTLPSGLTYKVPKPVAEMLAQAHAAGPARAPAPAAPPMLPPGMDSDEAERSAAFMFDQGYLDAPAHRRARRTPAAERAIATSRADRATSILRDLRGDPEPTEDDPTIAYLRSQGF